MSNVHYIYRRKFDDNGKIVNNGGLTVAYREIEPGMVEYALAFCGPLDNFNKAYGRAKAGGRLNSARHKIVAMMNMNEFRNYAHTADPFALQIGFFPEDTSNLLTSDVI